AGGIGGDGWTDRIARGFRDSRTCGASLDIPKSFRGTPCHTADVRPCAWRDIQPAPRASCRRSSDGRLSGCRARSSTWPYWAASQRTRYHIHSRCCSFRSSKSSWVEVTPSHARRSTALECLLVLGHDRHVRRLLGCLARLVQFNVNATAVGLSNHQVAQSVHDGGQLHCRPALALTVLKAVLSALVATQVVAQGVGDGPVRVLVVLGLAGGLQRVEEILGDGDRKSTRLNSSHVKISYAVFCLKKKKKTHKQLNQIPLVIKQKIDMRHD